MEFWVRSQDRELLIKCNSIDLEDNSIQVNFNDGVGFIVGEYSTKERAMEVLDEIHNHLEKMYWFNPQVEEDRRLKALLESYVYNIPEE